jgi:large subunit ribosomal protein L31
MKPKIHPTYFPEATVTCACGNTWKTGSTKKVIHTEVCSKCHPFFTGQQQRIVDIEGQVDRFYRKLQSRQEFVDQAKARVSARTSLDRPITELELSNRAVEALAKANLTTVGQVLDLLKDGDAKILEVDGFGRRGLIDMKKRLRQLGYALPEAAQETSI